MSKLAPWTPFERGHTPKRNALQQLEFVEGIARDFGVSTAEARKVIDDIDQYDEVWLNSRYQVNIRRGRAVDGQETGSGGFPEMIHLSIKRLDKEPVGIERYRDFMRIKDELVGTENEAVELYPRRSRETDSANQYHLWVLVDSKISFPFGFRSGRHVNELTNGVGSAGARQAPFEPHHPR